MISENVKSLLIANPLEVEKFTGIKDWETKSTSYAKHPNSNAILPHDASSIYCLDKLHLTFVVDPDSRKYDYRKLFKMKQHTNINDVLTVVPDSRSQSNYYYSFSLVVEGVHFAKLGFHHTRQVQNCLLEIDNQILYDRSSLWIIAGIFQKWHVSK